jgi:NADH-quinone oxidoreductase subunit K
MSGLMAALGSAGALLAQAAAAASAGGIGLRHYLAVGALAFTLGLVICIVRRNAIAVLMGIELMLNSAGLNFVAFSRFLLKDTIDGQLVTLFIIVLAAAEASLALGIILNIFHNTNSIEVAEADRLKG